MARIIDVVEHPNVQDEELVFREPQSGAGDFRLGSQCIVREGQAAVFVNRGQALDALGPGAHTLSTANIPLLASVVGLFTNGRNPFPAEVYFVNMKDLPQVRWGTNPPITIFTPTQGVGVMQLMSNGVVDISITDPVRFVKQYAVGKPMMRIDDIKERIQTLLLGELTSVLSQQKIANEQEANAMLTQLEGASLAMLNEGFQAIGMRIKAFESKPFQRKQLSAAEIMQLVGNKEDIFRIEQLDVARTAAGNEGLAGGLAGAGVGFGVGQNLAGAMGNPQANAMQNQQQMMMMQMMQQMMNQMNNQGGQQAPAQNAPAASGAPAQPQTAAEVQALIDALDSKLANGEISEAIYNKLVAKWEERLKQLGG